MSRKKNEIPAQEQNVLDWLVDRARTSELSDSDLKSAAGGQDLASSLGFEEDAESLEVKWSLSF